METTLRQFLQFEQILRIEDIQSLWSGYGMLSRVFLLGGEQSSVIVKQIQPPLAQQHPRGWNTNLSHQRKLRSYEVEMKWYSHYAKQLDEQCRVPQLLGIKEEKGQSILILEDLDQAGFALRKSHLNKEEVKNCLSWLAAFHARFINVEPKGLWETGTYWHLETRPEEWHKMPESPLKSLAKTLDKHLNSCRFNTLVHGDAKYANFCFAGDGAVAAVDFQYVGGGCGMKDVAYLLSCWEGGFNRQQENDFLDHYFRQLQFFLQRMAPAIDFQALHAEWSPMYVFAWADFERFLQGWAPGHWKSSSYSQQLVTRAIELIDSI